MTVLPCDLWQEEGEAEYWFDLCDLATSAEMLRTKTFDLTEQTLYVIGTRLKTTARTVGEMLCTVIARASNFWLTKIGQVFQMCERYSPTNKCSCYNFPAFLDHSYTHTTIITSKISVYSNMTFRNWLWQALCIWC